MAPTLPVPSKGALRTLRNLALGTSCTVAFGAGLITEDRRRRIHAAREVHDNAKKLKSSRKYHSASTAAVESFEGLITPYGDVRLWRPSKPLRASEDDYAEPTKSSETVATTRPKPSVSGTTLEHKSLDLNAATLKKLRPIREQKVYAKPYVSGEAKHIRQIFFLVREMEELLRNNETPSSVDAAGLLFFGAFEEGLFGNISGISEALLDVAIQLSEAFRRHGRLDAAEKILDIVLRCGPVEQEAFFAFGAESVISDLLEKHKEASSILEKDTQAYLHKACVLYLTNFKRKPEKGSQRVQALGKVLCAETCRRGLFTMTEEIYWRMDKFLAGAPNEAIHFLITASHGLGKHKKVQKYFERFYLTTSPDQLQFYKVIDLVMDSVLKFQGTEPAETTLLSVLQMAEREGLLISTTSILKVLGDHWKTYRDIIKSKDLFNRVEYLLHVSRHPQAVYGAIIQFCVEAGDEASALSYYEILRKHHEPTPADIRIYGHFAYAKAMKGDWVGVRGEFLRMKKMTTPDYHREHSAAFTHILRMFVQSHTTSETEDFIRESVEEFDLKITPYISNTMIDKYLQVKEIDSVSRWIDYTHSVGCSVDPAFFNTFLKNLHRTWNLNFEQVWAVYQSVRKLGIWTGSFINKETLSTLRDIAISDCGSDTENLFEKLNHVHLYVPVNADRRNNIRAAMSAALSSRDNIGVLKLYKGALREGIPLSQGTVSIALKASLALYPNNIDATACLLEWSQEQGQDIYHSLSTLFTHQISQMKDDTTVSGHQIMEMTRKTVSALESRHIQVPTRIITSTMSVLTKRGYFYDAINFWDSISHRPNSSPIPLDLETLTVLLQAFIGLRDPVGLRWVLQMLQAKDINPDKRFSRILLIGRKAAKEQFDANPPRGALSTSPIGRWILNLRYALDVVQGMKKDAGKEREAVKFKAIEIMEKADLVQRQRDRESTMVTNTAYKGNHDVVNRSTPCPNPTPID